MSLRTLASGFAMLVLLAGCSSAAPAGSSSPAVASTPAASETPAAVSTPVPVATPEATAPETTQGPVPSFADDPELAARFPTQVAGQPVANVMTGKFIDFLRALGSSQADIDKLSQQMASLGIDLNTVSLGSANATVNGSLVGILALRFPGHDANQLVENYATFSDMTPGDTLSQETVGGKNVTVVRSSGGFASTWLYANGDVMWSTNTSNQEEAAAIFAALP
ncbi:MAG: hypothetical protein M3R57_03985 [Chloroflexota bacterium]|nr:hypothetical protein [Chloroflexota bacterium]